MNLIKLGLSYDKDSKDLQNLFLNNLSYEFHTNRSEIFRKGEYGYKYYIILKGFCYCLLPKSEKEVQD